MTASDVPERVSLLVDCEACGASNAACKMVCCEACRVTAGCTHWPTPTPPEEARAVPADHCDRCQRPLPHNTAERAACVPADPAPAANSDDEPLHVVECPSCGASIRARMADAASEVREEWGVRYRRVGTLAWHWRGAGDEARARELADVYHEEPNRFYDVEAGSFLTSAWKAAP